MNLGPGSLILIVVIALIIFGPKKLPELGRAAGTTLREFRNATRNIMDDSNTRKNDEDKK